MKVSLKYFNASLFLKIVTRFFKTAIPFLLALNIFSQCKEDPEPQAVFKATVDGVYWESTKDYPMLIIDKAGAVKPFLQGSIVDKDGRIKSEISIKLIAGISEKKYSGTEAELFLYEENYQRHWEATGSYIFVIEKYKNNRVSGYFNFTASNPSPDPSRVITDGIFENVPVVEKDTGSK